VLFFRWLSMHTKIKCFGVSLPFYGDIYFFFPIFKLFSAHEKRPELHRFPPLSPHFYFGCLVIMLLTLILLCRDSGAWKYRFMVWIQIKYNVYQNIVLSFILGWNDSIFFGLLFASKEIVKIYRMSLPWNPVKKSELFFPHSISSHFWTMVPSRIRCNFAKLFEIPLDYPQSLSTPLNWDCTNPFGLPETQSNSESRHITLAGRVWMNPAHGLQTEWMSGLDDLSDSPDSCWQLLKPLERPPLAAGEASPPPRIV
jgi:hypothetical protein